MSNAADAVRRKLKRADYHFECFKSTLGLGPEATRRLYTLSVVGPQSDRDIHVTTDLPEPGPDCGIVIGDVVHQLRAALDHVVYAMVKPLTDDPRILRKVQFPIHADPAAFRNSRSVRRLSELFASNTTASSAIEATQPYKRQPEAPKGHPLWILSELDNIDKHRTLLVLNRALTAHGTIESSAGKVKFTVVKQPISANGDVLTIGGDLPDPPFVVDVESVSPYVVFAGTDGLCDDLSVFPLIRKMMGCVEDVVSAFETTGLI